MDPSSIFDSSIFTFLGMSDLILFVHVRLNANSADTEQLPSSKAAIVVYNVCQSENSDQIILAKQAQKQKFLNLFRK